LALRAVNTLSAADSLFSADEHKTVHTTSSTAVTLTVQKRGCVDLPVGSEIEVVARELVFSSGRCEAAQLRSPQD